MEYVRFRSKYPNQAGEHVGVFGLVNVLGRHGMLTPDEERFRQDNNAWYDAEYPNPSYLNPSAYDPEVNPHAAAWFKPTASKLIDRISGYLSILTAHNVAWEEVRTTDPGRIVYSDDYQAVAVPHRGPVTTSSPSSEACVLLHGRK